MAFQGKDVSPSKKTGFTFKGKEIILSKTRGAPFRGLVQKGMEKGIYPEEKRIEAVTLYAATGNIPRVSDLCGVPESTIKTWRKTEWFQEELLREIRVENNEKIDAKFTQIIENALEQLLDRVENGDYHITRDGNLVRKPVNAKDLSLVSAINVDKRQLLRGEPTSRSEAVGQVEEKAISRLENLAQTFENLARYGRNPKVIQNTEQVEDAILIESVPGGRADEASSEGHQEEQISKGEV